MDEDEDTSIKPNIEEAVESSTMHVQADDVVLEWDVSSLVKPDATVVARIDDTAVTDLVVEIAGEPEDVLNGGAQGADVMDTLAKVVVGQRDSVVGVELEEVGCADEEKIFGGQEEDVENQVMVEVEMESEIEVAVGGEEVFVNKLHSKAEGGMEEVATKAELKQEVEAEVTEEGLTVETMMESEIVDLIPVDAVNGEEDQIRVMEGIEKDKTETMKEVEEDECGPMEDVEKDLEIVGTEKDVQGESDAAEDDDEGTVVGEDIAEVVVGTPESAKSTGGKRKRGTNLQVTPKPQAARKIIEEEEVCFICFDGGELVLCDRRGCPKAYHPSCVNRDEAFFQAKGRWNCGWHLCNMCQKDAYVMCYTCTFSSCKSCLKDAGMLCVKKSRGFCGTCMKIVLLIENNDKGNKEEPIDFDDKSSWEYLFKDYWIEVKERFSLSLNDLIQDINVWKGSEGADKQESPSREFDDNGHSGSGSDNSAENFEASKKRRRKLKKKRKSITKVGENSAEVAVGVEENFKPENTEWATEELLEFAMHMRNGDRSAISQYDIQPLLLEYIQINGLRDNKHKSQIICDSRLNNLFGKPRVGHFEMLKLIESHFLIKEDSQIDGVQGIVVNTESSLMADDETPEAHAKSSKKDRKSKTRKKDDRRGAQFNCGEYAAIDTHNISLIYLRRKLVEDLLEDTEKFQDKVIGTFVRIRIIGANQKQDLYRLVQVVGTSKAAEQYKVGKRTADIMLEILNLNKTEVISIDTISNQEFTEDECKRLRQSIKCGFIRRLTVGDILGKAMEVQAARVNDWFENEIVRISHLCDRASDMGHRKELRESVEKLQKLKTPEERLRRLEEVPRINTDPNMDPSYESEDNSDNEEKKQEIHTRSRNSSFNRRESDPVSSGKDFLAKDSLNGTGKNSSKNWEVSRNLSYKDILPKAEDAVLSYETTNDNSWNHRIDDSKQKTGNDKKPCPATYSEAPAPSRSPVRVETNVSINESEKIFHYKDPSGKTQGPFSLVRLRKWSNNGYFPPDLRIWRVLDKEDDGILLTDALAGKFDSLKQRSESQETPSTQQSFRGLTTPLADLPKLPTGGRNDSTTNLSSPTPQQSTPGGGPSGDGGLQSATPLSVSPSASTVPNTFEALGTSMPTSQDSLNSNSSFGATINSVQGQQIFQSGHQVPVVPDNNHMVQPIPGQNSVHGWSGAPAHNVQPNPSINVAGQMVAYNQWTGGPSMVQTPGTVPQSDPWGQGPPIPSNQPNMQQPPNVTWGPMQANPNMGWAGNAPGNPNMNWGAMNQPGPTWVMPNGGNVQGPIMPPGNMNGGWVNPGVNIQGVPQNQGWVNSGVNIQGIPPNSQGWVTAPSQVPVNGNPSWVMLPGNQANIAQVPAPPGMSSQGWIPPTGNNQGPAPGNVNQGRGPPAPSVGGGNQGWHNQKQQNGNRFSGQRGSRGRGFQGGDRGRKPWNRDNRGGRDRNNRERDGDRRSSCGRGRSRDDGDPNCQVHWPKWEM